MVVRGAFYYTFHLLVPLCLENLFRTLDDEGALLVVSHARVDRVHFVARLCERLPVLRVHAEPAGHVSVRVLSRGGFWGGW